MQSRIWGAAFGIVLISGAWIGCGDDDTGSADNGGADGGGAGGSAGDAGELPKAKSKREACRRYIEAACQRQFECRLTSRLDQCFERYLPLCPDYLFSEGSARTLEGVAECANAYTTFSCDGLRRGQVPDCALPGTRPAGAACTFGTQCASAACSTRANLNTCGQCFEIVAPGASCDPLTQVCPHDQLCSSGTCTPANEPPKIGRGGACVDSSQCSSGLTCDSTLHVCGPLLGAGKTCTDSLECERSLYCERSSHTCRALPTIGQACLVVTGTPPCEPGAYCATLAAEGGTLSQCVAKKALNQACATRGECAAPLVCNSATKRCATTGASGDPCDVAPCGAEFYCDLTAMTCRQRKAAGVACSWAALDECVQGLRCVGEDGSYTALWPTQPGVCRPISEEGEACSDGGSPCAEGTRCSGGTCVAIDELTWFGAHCSAK